MSRPGQPTPTRAALAATAALLLAACSDGAGPVDVEPITELPRQLSVAEEGVRDASNAFAFDLAPRLLPGSPDENLFWSPLSASMALGMLLNGADGESYGQLRDVLGLDGMSQEEINAGYGDLIDLLVGLDPTVTVEIGNSVWTAEGFPVLPEYLERVRGGFRAEAAEVDLQAPATLHRINGWASDATNGLIDPMFEDPLPPALVALLLNAVYFRADWTVRFDEGETGTAAFHRTDGSTVDVDMMQREGGFSIGWTEDAQIAELPYGGGAFAMTLAMPHEGTVEELAAGLTPERWQGWLERLGETERARLYLPRFELEWGADMSDALKAAGMVDLFDPATADLSRLTPTPDGLYVSFVKQKAFVAVDERGTEAAAVTGVGVEVVSLPPTFRADRPFLFVLRERLTGTILFMGIVNDPTAG